MSLIFAHKKEDPFVRIHKPIAEDCRLSWKARGILMYAFSRPTDWQFYMKQLEKQASDGRESLKSGLRELEKFGYLHKKANSNEKTGKMEGWTWHFFEEPISAEEFKNRFSKNLSERRESRQTANGTVGILVNSASENNDSPHIDTKNDFNKEIRRNREKSSNDEEEKANYWLARLKIPQEQMAHFRKYPKHILQKAIKDCLEYLVEKPRVRNRAGLLQARIKDLMSEKG